MSQAFRGSSRHLDHESLQIICGNFMTEHAASVKKKLEMWKIHNIQTPHISISLPLAQVHADGNNVVSQLFFFTVALMPLMMQEFITLSKQLRSLLPFCVVCFVQSLVFCIDSCMLLFVFMLSFGHCIIHTSSDLWFLIAILVSSKLFLWDNYLWICSRLCCPWFLFFFHLF